MVGGGETEGDEMAADPAAMVGGEDSEKLKDCWMYKLITFHKKRQRANSTNEKMGSK